MKTKKEQIEIIAVAVLVLFFLIFLSSTLKKYRKSPAQSTKSVSRGAARPASFTQAVEKSKQTKVPQNWGRDPFVLQERGAGAGVGSLVLSGIIWDRKNPRAIVNNEIYKAGDKIGKVEILEIKEDSIIVKENGKVKQLRLY